MQYPRWWVRMWQRNSGRFSLALSAGLIYPLAFAPFDLWPLAIFTLVVLHQLILRANTNGQIFGICFVFGVGKFGSGAYWILVSLISYAEVHVSVAVGLFIVFLLLSGTLFSVLAFFKSKSRYATINALVFATGLTIVEILLSLPWSLSFPWLHLGYALIDTPLSVFAPIGGVWAVSFVGAFSAAALSLLVTRHWPTLATASVLWFPGLFLTANPSADGESFSVALVQGNVPLTEKWETNGWRNSLVRYSWLSKMSPSTDLIVWPESALPVAVSAREEEVFAALEELDGQLVFGALEERKLTGRSAMFNVVVTVDHGELSYFRKERLVPFGEYIPWRHQIGRVLQPIGYPMSSITPSRAAQTLPRIGDLLLAPAICYEIAYPELVRRRGSIADLIVVLSEDSWLGDTTGPWQHLQIARMRALELNRPLVRATNDGVTAIVDANGAVLDQLERYREDVLVGSVALQERSTLFARFGLVPIAGLFVLVSLISVVASQRDRLHRTRAR
ncbi:MAG: apolipoprotein N-acyltransferase [Gammaproteobacteria bacterium]|nr:apolipoprotein N-acyltransferase [Gammaproteobacteria bacterium]